MWYDSPCDDEDATRLLSAGVFFFAFAQLSPGVEAGQAGRRLQSGGSASAPREIVIIPPLVPQFRCFHFGSADRALERV